MSTSLRELEALRFHNQEINVDDEKLAETLTNLKLQAVQPVNLSLVYSKNGIAVLSECAFGKYHAQRPLSSLQAGKVLANGLLLRESTRQILTDLELGGRIVKFYSRGGFEQELTGARILFLLSYNSTTSFDQLVNEDSLIEHIRIRLDTHVAFEPNLNNASTTIEESALIESLKLIYNAHQKCSCRGSWSSLVPNLQWLLVKNTTTKVLIQPPTPQLLHALAVVQNPVDFVAEDKYSTQLLEILKAIITSPSPGIDETALISLLVILRTSLPDLDYHVRNSWKSLLLPSDDERDKPLGTSNSLASKLIQLQKSSGNQALTEAIGGLMFDLSDQDPLKLVYNIGYGNAAGYLVSHNIALPPEALETVQLDDGSSLEQVINPITGQRLRAESIPPTTPMTEIEKEREAEKMFVLLERLRSNGLISVENPLRTAQQSGVLEELSDSEPD